MNIRMDRDHIHKNKDLVIDSYIRNELSEVDADSFEEHLLYCKECRDALLMRERIAGSIQNLAAKENLQGQIDFRHRSRKQKVLIGLFAAAAGVALVLGIFHVSNRDIPSGLSKNMAMDTVLNTLQNPEAKGEEMEVLSESIEVDLGELPEDRRSYLASCQPNPIYENQIGIHLRSGNLQVLSPPDSVERYVGSFIEVQYQAPQLDSLFLVLLNRHGEILSEEKIASPHELILHVQAGLYYWQLTDNEELLHTAKIYVRPPR
ncbi:MAG: zf-HC2 domain-containing protein [Bacteroidetes bacterium]|nr:zf-HC2 domain-containing protein [Bacteroidota bacterium]